MNKKLIIAIDGPSGAGKSTLSKALAEKLGYLNIDTGAMYRSVALLAGTAAGDRSSRMTAALKNLCSAICLLNLSMGKILIEWLSMVSMSQLR